MTDQTPLKNLDAIKAHCNRCGGLRKHDVLYSYEIPDDLGEGNWLLDRYFFIRCGGCENIHLRHDFYHSGMSNDEGVPEPVTTYYPPAESRRKPEWTTATDTIFWAYTSDVGQLLSEIYRALQNDSPRLAAMGTRALLENIMIEQIGGDKGTLGRNIDTFFQAGFVAPRLQDLFRSFLIEPGNAAMHRNYLPEPQTLSVMLDLLENLIASLYVHPFRAQQAKPNIPSRLRINSGPPDE